MPELPEVESLRRLLDQRLCGLSVRHVEFVAPKIARYPVPELFLPSLFESTILGVGRRGKYLRLLLSRPSGGPAGRQELIVHLRMRGMLRVERADRVPGAYFCAALVLSEGLSLRYYDMWRWGEWTLLPEEAVVDAYPVLAALGPDALDAAFTAEILGERLARRRGALKMALLDQRLVAGLGNIYCDESLHRARLHPARSACGLNREEVSRLHNSIVSLLCEAVAQGGARAEVLARECANLENLDEIYTPRVYDRSGQPCPVCGRLLVKFQLGGRGTTICPNCQSDADTARR